MTYTDYNVDDKMIIPLANCVSFPGLNVKKLGTFVTFGYCESIVTM